MQNASSGAILLYLPWDFDLLGGVDVVVDRLWQALERQLPGQAMIGIQDWEKTGPHCDTQGRRFLHLNLPAPDDSVVRYGITLVRRLLSLRRVLLMQNITTVNLHFPTLNAYPLAMLKRLGLWRGRMVLSFHGSDVNTLDSTSAYWRLIASQTDAVTACSASLASRIETLKIFRQPVQLIYNGIDAGRFLAGSESSALPEVVTAGRPYLLNVGNFVPLKGQDVLLAAYKRIIGQFPNLVLVFAGRTDNGIWLRELQEQTMALGLKNSVIFLENMSQGQVAYLMRQALCLAHVSHREGFCLVLLEAGVCGIPVIATRVGGNEEAIPNQDLGILIEDGDVDGLARELAALLAEPLRGKRIAENFRKRVETVFSVEAMVTGYLTVFAKMATES